MSGFFVDIRENKAEIVELRLSHGVQPKLPRYQFIGPFSTKTKAEENIPEGALFKGKVVNRESFA